MTRLLRHRTNHQGSLLKHGNTMGCRTGVVDRYFQPARTTGIQLVHSAPVLSTLHVKRYSIRRLRCVRSVITRIQSYRHADSLSSLAGAGDGFQEHKPGRTGNIADVGAGCVSVAQRTVCHRVSEYRGQQSQICSMLVMMQIVTATEAAVFQMVAVLKYRHTKLASKARHCRAGVTDA